MNINNLINTLQHSTDSDVLDNAVSVAEDYLEFNEFTDVHIEILFKVISARLDIFGDREEALNFLSNCSVSLGSLRQIDLEDFVSFVDGISLSPGETLCIINILANSDDPVHLQVLRRLSTHPNTEIAEEAERAWNELYERTR